MPTPRVGVVREELAAPQFGRALWSVHEDNLAARVTLLELGERFAHLPLRSLFRPCANVQLDLFEPTEGQR
jgi:hypothetical protein